jgi:hypothetical protein
MSKAALDENKVREAAYLFWLDDGQPEGRDQEHWLKAIDALTPPQPKKRARKAPAKKAAAKATTTKTKAPAKKAVKAKAAK